MDTEQIVMLAQAFREIGTRQEQASVLAGLINGVMRDWTRGEKIMLMGSLGCLWGLDRPENVKLN